MRNLRPLLAVATVAIMMAVTACGANPQPTATDETKTAVVVGEISLLAKDSSGYRFLITPKSQESGDAWYRIGVHGNAATELVGDDGNELSDVTTDSVFGLSYTNPPGGRYEPGQLARVTVTLGDSGLVATRIAPATPDDATTLSLPKAGWVRTMGDGTFEATGFLGITADPKPAEDPVWTLNGLSSIHDGYTYFPFVEFRAGSEALLSVDGQSIPLNDVAKVVELGNREVTVRLRAEVKGYRATDASSGAPIDPTRLDF